VVIAAAAAGVAPAARRCRSVALVMLVTVAARLPVEWLLKEIVQRPRPSGARLVAGTGFAYPSGHVLAAAATWGFVPELAGLYLKRRWLWWALSALTWTLIGAIAWTRVWLGVHWTSDVIGASTSLRRPVAGRTHAGSAARRHGFVPVRWPGAAPDATRAPVGLPSRGTHRCDRNTRHAHEVTDFDAVARPRRDKRERRTDRSARRRRAVTIRRARVMSLARGRRGGDARRPEDTAMPEDSRRTTTTDAGIPARAMRSH
jgi:PAP2 superfamily